ncbi:metal-dependent hydrolase [Candidatus Dependentiae bacterium]
MPSYQGHLIGGIATFSALAAIPYTANLIGQQSTITSIGTLLACLLGALFPDIDTQSKGRKLFYYALGCVAAITFARRLFGLTLFFIFLGVVPIFIRHRGITHNPLFVIGIPFIAAKIVTPVLPCMAALQMHYYLFFVAGALSHIILDFMPYKFLGVRVKPKQKRWTKKKVFRQRRL